MDLVRNVDTNRPRQAIVRSLVNLCEDLGIQRVAESIETVGERDFLHDAGIRRMQGYLFALSCTRIFTIILVAFHAIPTRARALKRYKRLRCWVLAPF